MSDSRDQIGLDELRDAVRQALEKHRVAGGQKIPDEGRGVDSALWRSAVEAGWPALAISEHYGGLGQGFAQLGVLYEELGRSLASAPLLTTSLAAHALSLAGNASQKSAYLPRIAAGELMATIALPTHATPAQEKAGRLNGDLHHVLDAGAVDLFFVPVRRGESDAVDLAIVSSQDHGVTIAHHPIADLTRTMSDVRLVDVETSPDRLLWLSAADWARLHNHAYAALACDCVGGAEEILSRTVEYMSLRVQFDRPIGAFQALKHRAASWKVLLEAATALTRHAAEVQQGDNPEASVLASGAKFYAADVYAAIAADAIQLHGGIGFTWEHVPHLFLRRAKLNQVLFGASADHKDRAARLAFAEERASHGI